MGVVVELETVVDNHRSGRPCHLRRATTWCVEQLRSIRSRDLHSRPSASTQLNRSLGWTLGAQPGAFYDQRARGTSVATLSCASDGYSRNSNGGHRCSGQMPDDSHNPETLPPARLFVLFGVCLTSNLMSRHATPRLPSHFAISTSRLNEIRRSPRRLGRLLQANTETVSTPDSSVGYFQVCLRMKRLMSSIKSRVRAPSRLPKSPWAASFL